jgi:hypothetical protein
MIIHRLEVVNLTVSQDGLALRRVSQDNGLASIEALVGDPNQSDTHTYDWSLTDLALVDSDTDILNNIFVLDPTSVSVGVYLIVVTVADSSGLTSTGVIAISIEATAPVLSVLDDSDNDGIDDLTEGLVDSDGDGISDYLDAVPQSNLAPANESDQSVNLLETETGLTIVQGATAFYAGGTDVAVTLAELETFHQMAGGIQTEDSYINVGGIYDFTISGLPLAGGVASVVIPLSEPIPNEPLYRKYMSDLGWKDFVIDERNLVKSATGADGVCPSLNDTSYVDRLVPGSWCVQLTLEDGGPNDADHQANGTIVDPSGLATVYPTVAPELSPMPSLAVTEGEDITADLTQYVTDSDSQMSDLQFSIINASQIAADFGVSIGLDGTGFNVRADNQLYVQTEVGFTGNVTITIQVKDETGNLSNQVSVDLTIEAIDTGTTDTGTTDTGTTDTGTTDTGTTDTSGSGGGSIDHVLFLLLLFLGLYSMWPTLYRANCRR